MATKKQRIEMGRAILNYEARRDSRGRLTIYELPSGDGGGRYEVAGINDRYHPDELRELVRMLRTGKFIVAEDYAISFYLRYTDVVATWQVKMAPGVEFFLRDCALNRGPTGAAMILQMALGVKVDGMVGPATRGVLATNMPGELLSKLRVAREKYERDYVKRGERSKFWGGLVNRWNKVLVFAEKLEQ